MRDGSQAARLEANVDDVLAGNRPNVRLPKPRRVGSRAVKAETQRVAFARAVSEGMRVRYAVRTKPGKCVACGKPRRVHAEGPEAGCHIARSACEHCGHVEPA